ncbi:MAG: glycosyltransferase family 4 protein [Candidatus Lokiarchaeota archaeon]|nr:glycosyltransferase family 4 protein [Candidatus Lokiarchaeota archaeon]
MKILLLPRYSDLGASSRIRLYNYIPYLETEGWEIVVKPLLKDIYINYLYKKTKLPFFSIIKSYLLRIFILFKKRKYDLIWIQQEAFPWIPAWFERLILKSKIPLVVDYDDASFHRYDLNKYKIIRKLLGKKIDRIMAFANTVTAGNKYLADRAIRNKSKNVVIIPSVVDKNFYIPTSKKDTKSFIIGWVGSPSTIKYLLSIVDELKKFCTDKISKVVALGSNPLPKEYNIEIIKWSLNSEVGVINTFNVGIMPLDGTPWERGKCGYKLIQYMACGIPVIASNVGVNNQIVKHGINGFLAGHKSDWIKYLSILKNDLTLRKTMGLNGRKTVEEKYSYQITSPVIIDLFKNIIKL